MMASLSGHNTVVELLLSRNADPNLKNNVSLTTPYTGMQFTIKCTLLHASRLTRQPMTLLKKGDTTKCVPCCNHIGQGQIRNPGMIVVSCRGTCV